MRSGLIAAQALSLLFFTGVATAQDINETRTKFDSPAPADLLRRWNCRATVLGNYLYIDGGELGELVDGKATSFPNNSTLSIDLSKSWLTSSVEIRANGKPVKDGPLSMGYEAIWNDPTGSAFYTWGGYTTRGVRPAAITKEGIWKFTVDGKGGGAWLLEEPSNPQVLKTLKYAEDGAYTATNTTGFWYGGFSGSTTDPSQTVDQAVPGLVSYDMTRQTWRNDSALALSPPNGTARGAKAEYVPRFGPNGIVMILGGLSYSPFGNPGRDSGGLDFGNLTFFDPVTRNIYWQTTTGTVPAARWRYCSVGIDGGNGTYEIFIFGGQTADKNLALDDVYVLSLPGFVWTKAAATSPGQPRSQHTCVVVGKRQLLVVGGANYNIPSGRWQDPDPFPQGLGLFDMTDLTWSKEGQYKADAEPYQSPNAVKDWYSKTDLSTLSWSSSEVKELFVTASGAVVPANQTASNTGSSGANGSSNSNSGSDSNSGSGDAPNPSQSPLSSTAPASSSGLPDSARIAVATVASVVGVAVMVAVTAFLVRRRYKRRLESRIDNPDFRPHGEGKPAIGLSEVYGDTENRDPYAGRDASTAQCGPFPAPVLPAHLKYADLPPVNSPTELPIQRAYVELDGLANSAMVHHPPQDEHSQVAEQSPETSSQASFASHPRNSLTRA